LTPIGRAAGSAPLLDEEAAADDDKEADEEDDADAAADAELLTALNDDEVLVEGPLAELEDEPADALLARADVEDVAEAAVELSWLAPELAAWTTEEACPPPEEDVDALSLAVDGEVQPATTLRMHARIRFMVSSILLHCRAPRHT
jgi:hypothetical protein